MENKKFKIVFFGSPDFSINILKSLLENSNFDVQAIVTQEDKEFGRHKTIKAPEVKKFVLDSNLQIPIYQPTKLNKDTELIEKLKKLQSDFFVVVAYGQIISEEVLQIPKYGCINVHGSILPQFRGASPIHAVLLNNEKTTGITIMEMAKGMDDGDIYLKKEIDIDEDDDIESLSKKLALLSSEILPETLIKIANKEIKKTAQDDSQATYCKKIEKEDGKINWAYESAEKILGKFKAYKIWPQIYTSFKDKKLKLLEIQINKNLNSKKAGEVFLDENNEINISSIDKQSLIIKKVQLEGKNPCDIKDFARGYKDFVEIILQ